MNLLPLEFKRTKRHFFCHCRWCPTYLKCLKLSTRRPTFTHHHTLLYTHVQSQCDQGPCDLVSDSRNSGTEAFLSFFKGWLMLSLRANTGTNWPPPPFFLSFSPWLFLSPYLFFFLLFTDAPSFSTKISFSFLHFPLPSTPPPHLPLTFFMVFGRGATRQRNNSKSLHIAGALVSGGAPLHWHISLSGLTQQTAPAMTNSLDAATASHTNTHTHTKDWHEDTLYSLQPEMHVCLWSRQL